jgi:hypothetical protein
MLNLPFQHSNRLAQEVHEVLSSYTLATGIDVGPTFINFGIFSRPYGLIREYIKLFR